MQRGEPVRLVQRLPRSLHTKPVARAKADGVSLNTMVVALLAESIGQQGKSYPPQDCLDACSVSGAPGFVLMLTEGFAGPLNPNPDTA